MLFGLFLGAGVTRKAGNMSRRLPWPKSLKDVLLVEESVGGGFGYVFGTDVGRGGQVGNGAGQLYDAGTGACRESHIIYDSFQQYSAFR